VGSDLIKAFVMYVGYNGVFVSFWNVDTRGTSLGADKGFLYCV
jgi:hypothetical protein